MDAASWGLRPAELNEAELADGGEWKRGWQFYACSSLEEGRRSKLLPTLTTSRQALLRSQSGFGAAAWLNAVPTTRETTLPSENFLVSLRRRLRWPLPVTTKRCEGQSCKKELDVYGDRRAACMRSGRIKRRALPVEKAWARVFREAGGRVREEVQLKDTTLNVPPTDQRRLEVVATGLPLYRGVPLGVDATVVSPLKVNRLPQPSAATTNGASLRRAEQEK